MQEYNSLLGKTITFDKLEELIQLAIEKEQSYTLEILTAAKEIAAKHGYDNFQLSTQVVDQIPESILSAIEKLPYYIDTKELEGLNAAVTPDDIYNMITKKMIERIKVVTGKEYKKKWDSGKVLHGKGFLTPMNFVSGKAYRGINFFMLKDFDIFKVFENPYFLTFKQIQTLKGKVKKGSKGHEVVYFTTLYKIHIKSSDGETIVDFGTYNKKRYEKFIDKNWPKIAPHTKTDKNYHKNKYIPILKYYNVFNGTDIEGIDFKLEELRTGKIEPEKGVNEELQLAEGIVNNYPDPQPKIMHGGDKAAYFINKNAIQMPHKEAFETIQDYYRTLFHELSHSTGDIKHLNREQDGFKRNPTLYAFEELIAEFGAVFLSAQAGFLWQSNKNHAEYVKHWSMHLKNAEKDNRYIMRAASAAQKSTDYVLNLDKEGVPAYLKDAAKQIKKENKENVTPSKYTKEKFERDLPGLDKVTQSYSWLSFDPPARAKREIKEWGDWLSEVYKIYSEKAKKQERLDEFHVQFDKYYTRLLKRKKEVIKARTGTASAAITGGSNFPVAKQRARHDRLHDIEGDFYKYRDYFIKKLETVIYENGGIKSGEKDTIDKLKKELESAKKEHKLNLDTRRAFKEYHKSQDKNILSKFNLPKKVEEQIIDNSERYGYLLGFSNTNSNAKVRRIEKRIKTEEARTEKYKEGNKETKFEHYTVLENVDENRLQILFDGKPSAKVREVLKKNGFRWSGKNVAWQRQLTRNAISSLRYTLPELDKLLEAETTTSLNAPWHEGKAKEALTSCGRLKRGYRYEKGGKIVKVADNKKSKKKTSASKSKHKTAVKSKAKADSSNLRFSLKDIHTDEKRFQNRSKLNMDVVNNIVDNFKATDLDPLVIWLDPKDNKHYLLAGHHRHEALKRLKRKEVPVRIANNDYPTEKDAIRYARELSNANRTLEQAHERAAIYRKKIKEGVTNSQLEKDAAIEGRNRSFVLNLAHLNANGKALQTVIQFADSASVQDKNEVNKIADWIGQARRNNKELTNAHENEMFDFLTDSNSSKRITNKTQFIQLITSTTSDMFYNYDKPLNLKRFKYESEGEKQYDYEVKELQEEISSKQQDINDVQDRFTNPNNAKYINANTNDYNSIKNTADKRIASLNESIRALQRKLQELYKNKRKYTNAGSNQAALFGAKKETKRKKLAGVSNILSEVETESEFFTIPGAVGEFLQQVERKPVHSVVVTLDGAQGAGKTTTLYRFINSFASAQLPCVYFSLEEHPESHLAREKVERYIDKENVPYIDAVGELDSKEQFYKIVDQYDFIFIDSWQKLVREIGNIKLDEDLRKKFNGKVFVIIFQQTTTGRTKGGAEIVFDGDIIIKMVKEARFEENYAYMDKNRYTLRPIDELRYNIAGDYTYSTVNEELEEEEIAFNFITE